MKRLTNSCAWETSNIWVDLVLRLPDVFCKNTSRFVNSSRSRLRVVIRKHIFSGTGISNNTFYISLQFHFWIFVLHFLSIFELFVVFSTKYSSFRLVSSKIKMVLRNWYQTWWKNKDSTQQELVLLQRLNHALFNNKLPDYFIIAVLSFLCKVNLNGLPTAQ